MKRAMVILQTGVFLAAMFAFGCKSDAEAPKKEKKKVLYSIAPQKAELKKGTNGKAAFDINLNKGAKIHPKAPFRCAVKTTAGLAAKKKSLGHPDTVQSKDKRKVQVQVEVAANKAGEQAVNLDCSFFVCTKDICSRHVEKIKIAANVK